MSLTFPGPVRTLSQSTRALRVRPLPGVLAAALLSACGSSTPGQPSPPAPPNQPPTISSIELSVDRVEVGEDVTVRAVVQDAETPVESLIFEWSADGGTFSGSGREVTWKAPEGGDTPRDYELRLTVREPYGTPGAGGARPEHRVTANSPAVRVHDSPAELRRMGMSFLEKFADSDLSADECLVDFTDSCSGKASERRDIEDNRRYYEIQSSSLNFDRLTIASNRLSARMVVRCEFRSRIKRCPDDAPGCVVGTSGRVRGDCNLTAVYEDRRWWLCTSTFNGMNVPGLVPFFR